VTVPPRLSTLCSSIRVMTLVLTPGVSTATVDRAQGRRDRALRALMAEVEREAHADSAMPPEFTSVSARWTQVSDAIRATVHARIADVQAQAPKR